MGSCCASQKPLVPYLLNKESISFDTKQSPREKDRASVVINRNCFVRQVTGHIFQHYKIMGKLGRGGYGVVKKAKHKVSKLMRAVKVVPMDNLDESKLLKLRKEVEILKNLDHPNIIRVLEYFETEENFFIVTELCTGGELFDRIAVEKYLDEKEVVYIMREIFHAINYCHSNNVVHRDLKPENIMYSTDNSSAILKLIDFGTSRVFREEAVMKNKYGTSYYIAPEVLNQNYNEKCDIWSCGVIMYVLLTGYPPFNGYDDADITAAVKEGKYSLETKEMKRVSDFAKDLLTKCLEKNLDMRFSASDVLAHLWFQSFDFSSDGIVEMTRTVLRNLINFKVTLGSFQGKSKIRNAFWIFIVNYIATEDEKLVPIEAFKVINKSGNGKIDRGELRNAFNRFLPDEVGDDELDEIFERLDTNKSLFIDYNGITSFHSEFLMASVTKRHLLSKERLQKCFKIFDKDKTGYLEIPRIRKILDAQGYISEETWTKLFKRLDVDGDNRIDFYEFCRMFNSQVKSGSIKKRESTGEKI